MKYYFLPIFSILFLFSCKNSSSDCDNIDDCLSKYKFEEARNYASELTDENYDKKWYNYIVGGVEERKTKNEELYKIISTETDYWISQNELEKAENTCNELKNIQLSFNYGSGDRIGQEELEHKISEFNFKIIRKYCEMKQYDKAKAIAIKLPEQKIIETSERISSGFSGNDPEDILICRNKYNSTKKGLKSNQRIEPFKETSGDDYKISTYEYPRNQALKIINDCF
ncbi:hypothetical protein [Flavobacterium sp.]|uniref:hypothetical protein n=1 Tax=Flavobacterium sp. TaxID=239 RepID=UPI0037526137